MINYFNKNDFLEVNPDIDEKLLDKQYVDIEDYLQRVGLKEIEQGKRKFHKSYAPYDDKLYGKIFPDVEEAIQKKEFNSKFEHFSRHGYKEILDGIRVWRHNSENENIDTVDTIKAYIDRFENNTLWGWALDLDNLDEKLSLEVYIDGNYVGDVIADLYREDIKKGFRNDGYSGFEFVIEGYNIQYGLGLVTLKKQGSIDTIPTNVFSIIYNMKYLLDSKDADINNVDNATLENIPIYQLAVDSYHTQKYDKSKNIIEELLENYKELPINLSKILLNIYFSENNYVKILEYYYHFMDGDTSIDAKYIINQEYILYCSSLWMKPANDYLSTQDINKLKIFMIILKRSYEYRSKLTVDKCQNLSGFLVSSLRSGILFDCSTIESISELIVEDINYSFISELEINSYCEHLDFFRKLLTSIHIVDYSQLNKINMYINLIYLPNKSLVVVEIFHLYITYVNVLITSKRLNCDDARQIIRIIEKRILKIIDEKEIDIFLMDLLYICRDDNQILAYCEAYIKEDISRLDWKSTYFSEILWLYFENSNFVIDDISVMNFLYRRQEENRTTYREDIIILVELNRWRETLNIKILNKTINNIINNLLVSENKELNFFAKNIIEEFFLGTLDIYFLNAEQMQGYFSGIKNIPTQLPLANKHFELYNLYYLSILNNDISNNNILVQKIDKKYIGLFSKEKKNYIKNYTIDIDIVDEPSIAVLAVVGNLYEKEYLDYYESVLLFNENKFIHIYLYLLEYYYILYIEENSIEIKKHNYTYNGINNLLYKIEYDLYILLNRNSIIHHNLFKSIDYNINIHFTSQDSEDSFSLTSKHFKYFQDIASGKDIFSYFIDFRKKIKEYLQLNQIAYNTKNQGIVSFKNIEEEKIELLTNFDYPIFELDNILESLIYLKNLYLDKRIKDIISINLNNISLNLLKNFEIHEDKDDIACFLVQRNEYMRLDGFLKYYRSLGVSKFYIIDNASDDDVTLNYLLNQKDVEVYSSIQAYSQSLFGIVWIELLIRTKRVGLWNLVVDADELLCIDHNSLQELCSELDKHGYDSLYAPFLDMYSNVSIDETKYEQGMNILNKCKYYDRNFYTFFNPNGGPIGMMNTYQGGLRSRIFGLDSVVLNKIPLFKFDIKHKLREGMHWIDNATPAYGRSVLLHFKYIHTFHTYVMNEIKRGQHWNGASEYLKYSKFILKNPNLSFYNEVLSEEFTSTENFYDKLFLPYKMEEC